METTDTRMTRDEARSALVSKIAREHKHLADPRAFSTIDPNYLIRDAEFRLRWIDCAPEGARYCVAPLQDKNGVPMGGTWSENLGACKALREARTARGLHPLAPR